MKGLIVIFSFTASLAYGQLNVKPFIKAGGNFSINKYNILYEVNVAGGVHFNDHISLQIGGGYIDFLEYLKLTTLSLSSTYRILNSKHIFSPVVGVDLGTEVWSNASGRFVKTDFVFTQYDPAFVAMYGLGQARYKRGLFFSKVKLLADFKIKSFNISIGPTFNLMCFKLETVKKYYSDYQVLSEYIDGRIGFGGELSVMYTFPMKKRDAKKAQE